MKEKRIFFIVTSIIAIVTALYMFIYANSIMQTSVDSMKKATEVIQNDFMSDSIERMEKTGSSALRMESAISIMINLAIIYTALKDRILKNKGLMITAMIFMFFLGGTTISMLSSVAGFILLLLSKRVNPEDFPEKNELPKIENKKLEKLGIIMAVLLVMVYFSQFIWGKYIPDNIMIHRMITILFYSVTFIIAIIYWNKKIIESFKSFFKNFMTYIKYMLPRIGVFYLIYLVISIITMVITKNLTSANQESLESMNKYVVIPLALFYAPIVEETIFRGIIRNIIKNKTVYVIASGIAFGLLHTLGQEADLFTSIIVAMPYATMGGFLAYLYAKTDNISTNMFMHFLINLFASIVTLMT